MVFTYILKSQAICLMHVKEIDLVQYSRKTPPHIHQDKI